MLGRAEEAEAMRADYKRLSGRMTTVSQPEVKTKEAVQSGRKQFNTHALEMSVSYRIHTEVSTENDVWTGAIRDTGNSQDTMPIQKSRNHRGRSMLGPCTPKCEHTTKAEHFGVHGILERQVSSDDL